MLEAGTQTVLNLALTGRASRLHHSNTDEQQFLCLTFKLYQQQLWMITCSRHFHSHLRTDLIRLYANPPTRRVCCIQ